MVQLTCTKCGGHNLVQNGRCFVCQSCGTYNTEQSILNLLLGENERALAEATQLDYEIKLLEEYKPYYDEFCKADKQLKSANEGCSIWVSCFGGLICGFLAWLVLGIIFSFNGVLFTLPSIIGSIWLYIRDKESVTKAQNRLDVARPNYEYKYAEIKEKINLIPERFWANGDVVRDYYQNWGAKNQKDLLAHLEEHYRKPDVIRETVPVYIKQK